MTNSNIRQQETRNERFIRLAEGRVNAALDKLRLIGQLANSRNYEFTEDQVDAMFRTIQSELNRTKAKFQNISSNPKRFKL